MVFRERAARVAAAAYLCVTPNTTHFVLQEIPELGRSSFRRGIARAHACCRAGFILRTSFRRNTKLGPGCG